MKKVIIAGILCLGVYWLMNGGLEEIGSDETTFPDTNQPNMKTKVPASANSDHIWLVNG